MGVDTMAMTKAERAANRADIVGYRTDGTPIRRTKPGTLTTQALVFCSECRTIVKSTGGIIQDALCLPCYWRSGGEL